MKPLFDNVAFVEVKVESNGGSIIYVPTDTKASYGKVIAIGPEVVSVEADSTIVPNWSKASKTLVDGEIVFLISEYDILAML